MKAANLSIRKRLGLELHRQAKRAEVEQHTLNYLFWECTLRCNLACKHCGSDCKKSAQHKDMPLPDFLKAIDSISPHVDTHKTMIVITGGEPLMRDDLEQCGLELYKREYPWGFVTNGLALTEQRLNRLMQSGLSAVTVSLDGFEEAHNTMRGHKQSYEKALNAIKLLVSKGNELIFDVVTCANPYNFEQLAEFKKMLIETGVKRWRVFTVFPVGRGAVNNDLQLSSKQFKQLFDFIKQTRAEGQIKLDYGCEGFLGNYEADVRDNFFFCRAGVNAGSILVDGSISGCPSIRSKYTQGNIYTDDFMHVWNNRFVPFREREWMKKDECANCKRFRYCEGNGMHLRDEDGNLLFCHLNRIKEGEK